MVLLIVNFQVQCVGVKYMLSRFVRLFVLLQSDFSFFFWVRWLRVFGWKMDAGLCWSKGGVVTLSVAYLIFFWLLQFAHGKVLAVSLMVS